MLQFLGPAGSFIESEEPARLAVRSGMTTRFLDALDSTDGALDPERAAGFFAFLDALKEEAFPRAWMVKAQVTGPVTLGMCIRNGSRLILQDQAARRILTDFVARQVSWQVDKLAAAGLPVLMVVDEPCLSLVPRLPEGVGPAIQSIAAVLDRGKLSGARVGLHCCATVPPALLCYPAPDVISFDANAHLETFLASDAIGTFLDRDGWLAAGLVPTTRILSREMAGALFTRWLVAASRVTDIARLARQTMVTATCGLGLVPVGAASASFRAARRLGERIRKVADH